MYMHRFGGVYADLDLTPLVSLSDHISIPNTNDSLAHPTAYVGRMSSEEFEHSIPNAFLASTGPFHPFWTRPLQFVRNSSTGYYRSPEELTGPIALRACVNRWIKDAENQSNELKIIEAGKVSVTSKFYQRLRSGQIYPFTWNDSPLSSKVRFEPLLLLLID
jgi:mannosyltransferase OCH1-like enzyme